MKSTLFKLSVILSAVFIMPSCFAQDGAQETPATEEATVNETVEIEENAEQTVPAAEAAPTTEAVPETEDAANAQPATEEAVNVDQIVVPETGTPTEYMTFIEKLMRVSRPGEQTREEMIAHYTKLCKAQIAAADKVIEHKESTEEQIHRAVAIKINCLRILIQTGDKDAKIQLYKMPRQLADVGQSKIADDIAMGLINLTFQDAQKTGDFSEIKAIVAQTDETIKKTPADDKDRLQRLYLIKLLCIKGLGQLQKVDNSAEFDAVVEEIQKAGLADMVEDIYMGKIAESLSRSVSKRDREMFNKTAQAVDNMLVDYGAKANVKAAAIAFQTAFTEELFDVASAAKRYEKYAQVLKDIKDEKVQEIVKSMTGSAKRLNLVGNEFNLTGKTFDGKDVKMADLKNKVVLINFWSPSVRPCLEEFDYLFRAYPVYREKGFEIVSIALDENREQLATVIKSVNFPWINMWDEEALIGDTPISKYYGIVAIPCMILIGKDGKVISIDARGEVLVNALAEEFGPLPDLDDANNNDANDDVNSAVNNDDDVDLDNIDDTADDANDAADNTVDDTPDDTDDGVAGDANNPVDGATDGANDTAADEEY